MVLLSLKEYEMKKKRRVIVLICVVCILLAIPVGYTIRTRGSVHVESQSDYTADETVYFLQKDPRWGDETLGNSSYTMASSGCLTTCIAAELQIQDIAVPEIQKATDSDNENTITPGNLNKYFSQQGVYDVEGNIQWDALEQTLGVDVSRLQAGEISNDKLDTLLSEGFFPIVFVRVNGWGNFHFVLITGSIDGEFLCMDPLNEQQVDVPLSRYGDRIYAVRYIAEING